MCPAILHFSKIAKMGRIKEEEKNLGNILVGGDLQLTAPLQTSDQVSDNCTPSDQESDNSTPLDKVSDN